MNAKLVISLTCGMFFCLVQLESRAETILFATGTLGPTGITSDELLTQVVPGSNLNKFIFVGARFELKRPAVVNRIGGHFASLNRADDAFFGAIVRLDGPDDFPDFGSAVPLGDPVDTDGFNSPDLRGHALLTFPEPSAEIFGDLQASLEPGWYGVLFGSGLFGANGAGGVVKNGSSFASTQYISGFGGSWGNSPSSAGANYSVYGKIVPEPPTLVMSLGLTVICQVFRMYAKWLASTVIRKLNSLLS